MHSESNYIYDAANAFRAPGLAPLTASPVEPYALPLDRLTNVRPSSQRGKLAAKEYRVIIVVEDVFVDTDEGYNFQVLVGAQNSAGLLHGTFVDRTGQYVLILDAETVDKQMQGNTGNIYLNADISGTAPSITFSAWLV